MSLQAPQLDGITRIANLARVFWNADAEILQLDVLFNDPATNWQADVTQINVDLIPSFEAAGLNAQHILDFLFILKTCRTALNSNLPATISMANLR